MRMFVPCGLLHPTV